MDPLRLEASLLGDPLHASVQIEAGVGVAGNWRQHYSFAEDRLSSGSGRPVSIRPDRGQSTTAWSSAIYYGLGAAFCPPGEISEVRQLAIFPTGGTARYPGTGLDEVHLGPYQDANNNPPCAPSQVEGDRPLDSTPEYPPWRYAAKLREAYSPTPDIVSVEARPQLSAISVHQQSSSRTLSDSPAQPVPIGQRFWAQTKGESSWEAHGHAIIEVETQLLTSAPHDSLLPNATHDAFGISNGQYEENRRFMMPSSDHAGLEGGNLIQLAAALDPKQVAFSQGECLYGTQGFVSGDDRETRGPCSKIRRLTPTHARLEKSIRLPAFASAFAPAPDATSFLTLSGSAGAHFPTRHSAKDKPSSSGVQRTERSCRGRAAGKPLYQRRKEHVPRERNVETLQERCRKQGGDDEAIGHLSAIFEEGVNKKALSRKMTEEDVAGQVFGSSTELRQVYWALLGQQVKDGFFRYVCRLCPEEKRYPYQNGKDVVPHIWKCHIGIGGEAGESG